MEQNLSNFQAQASELSEGLQQKINKQQEVFKKKFTGDEIAKTLGEVKSFMSGKPVTQYLLKKGGKYVDEMTDSISSKFNDFFSGGNQPIQMEDIDMAGEFGDVGGETGGATAAAVGGNTVTEGAEFPEVPEAFYTPLAGADTADTSYLDVTPDSAETSYLDVAPDTAAAQSSYLDVAPGADDPLLARAAALRDDGEYLDTTPEATSAAADPTNVLVASDEPLANVGSGAVTSSTIAGPIEPPVLSEGLVGDAGKVGGDAIDATLDATSGVLDAIPGADVLGLLLGVGLTVGSILKKPKMGNIKDTINSSYQIGI